MSILMLELEKGRDRLATYDMFSFPSIFRVLEWAPRLIEPPTPPTLRHIEHRQSWYATGVLDWTLNFTAPQWQLPLSSTGMMVSREVAWAYRR